MPRRPRRCRGTAGASASWRSRRGNLRRGRRRLGSGDSLDRDLERERANLQDVVVLDRGLTLERDIIDDGAVGAVEIADEHFAAANEDGTVPLADEGAAGAKIALSIATDDELGEGHRDRLPRALPLFITTRETFIPATPESWTQLLAKRWAELGPQRP